jgi:hypothetical protein
MNSNELRTEVRYELMRAAADHRYGLWAGVLAVQPRAPGRTPEDIREIARKEIRTLVSEGMLYLFRTPRAWGHEDILDGYAFEEALRDERNWRPRKSNLRILARLGATANGEAAFTSGEFGSPAPIQIDFAHASESLELQPFTAAELVSLGLATGGFFGGIWLGSLLNSGKKWSFLTAFAAFALGIVGMAVAVALWRRLNPGLKTGGEIARDPHYIPDSFMAGPTLDPEDALGNPRY